MSLPAHVRALLNLLQGKGSPALSEQDWRLFLAFADRTQCTLLLPATDAIPDWLAEAIQKRRAANRIRRGRIRAEYEEIASALTRGGIEFVLLKSFTHETGFGIRGEDRVQYDIDLLCRAHECIAANAVLRELSYQPHDGQDLSTIHERPLLRPSRWEWRGDYYDPEMPIAVELHSRLWDADADHLPLPETDQFWNRRTLLEVEGMNIPALAEADRVAFAALHVLRHALQNNVRLSHVWELACLLQTRADDAVLWNGWSATHSARSRMLQSIAMRFAEEWFDCRTPSVIAAERQSLSPAAQTWFARDALAPLENLVRPNKAILWLHRELIEDRWKRNALVFQRLLPMKLPAAGRRRERLAYHARALVALLAGRRARNTPSRTSHTSD